MEVGCVYLDTPKEECERRVLQRDNHRLAGPTDTIYNCTCCAVTCRARIIMLVN